MSTLLANRVQSANPRSIHRSSSSIKVKERPISSMGIKQSHTDVFDPPIWEILDPSTSTKSIHRSSSNVQAINVKERPTTSMGTQRSHTDVFDRPAWQLLEPSTSSRTINNYQRPRTGRTDSRCSTTSTQLSVGKLHSEEIAALLRSLDRDDKFVVQVDCLANYRKLVQTINLRRTPFDRKLLCTLQQRENRIIQRNACRDTRFRSLLDTLQPQHIIEAKRKSVE